MLHRNDYTIANLTNQIFDLPGRSDFESSGWNLGVHWDNEKEIFYNPYIVERKHIELSVHLEKEVVQTNENDADIIFGVPLKEGYTGIEYQPNIMNSFCNLGLVFGKNAGTYAQQFVYDLYTDPDLSNAAPLHFTDEGIYFGNLELMTPETLQTYYGLDQFSYEDFVERIDGTKSKLFDTGLTMLDACTMEQYLELMDYGSFESVGGIGKDIEVLDEILDTQPKYLNSIIERLNKLYQQCKD